MCSDDSQKDEQKQARSKKDRKMLSLEDAEKLLRQDAEAFVKQFEKSDSPEELRRRFERIIEQLEREGLEARPSDIYDEPDYDDEPT